MIYRFIMSVFLFDWICSVWYGYLVCIVIMFLLVWLLGFLFELNMSVLLIGCLFFICVNV